MDRNNPFCEPHSLYKPLADYLRKQSILFCLYIYLFLLTAGLVLEDLQGIIWSKKHILKHLLL